MTKTTIYKYRLKYLYSGTCVELVVSAFFYMYMYLHLCIRVCLIHNIPGSYSDTFAVYFLNCSIVATGRYTFLCSPPPHPPHFTPEKNYAVSFSSRTVFLIF